MILAFVEPNDVCLTKIICNEKPYEEIKIFIKSSTQTGSYDIIIILMTIISIHYHTRLTCQRIFPTSKFTGLE